MNNDGLRLRTIWLALGWLLIAAVVYLSLTPSPPTVGASVNDKLSHLLAYGVLMSWFMPLYPARAARRRLAVGFIAMGVLIEVLQSLGGVRFFELADMAANTLGVLGAWLLASTPAARLLHRLQVRLA